MDTTDTGQKPNNAKEGRAWDRLRNIRKRTVAGIVLLAALIGIVTAAVQYWPRNHSSIAFTDPSPGQVTPESCSFSVAIHGAPPSGEALVVSDQQQGTTANVDPTLNFTAVRGGPDNWHAVVQIGNSGTGGGTTYGLTIWQANADWITYLTQVTPSKRLWWGTMGPPPGASQIQTATVTRTSGKCP